MGSDYQWKRDPGRFNRLADKVSDIPANLLSRKGALTDSRKRELYEQGVIGQATIVKAPSRFAMSEERGGVGRYTVRIALPGREPYEVKTLQDVTGWDYRRLQPEMEVEVRVDPDDPERILLCPPDSGATRGRVKTSGYVDSSEILDEGSRATATVRHSEEMDAEIPGTDDRVFLLELELRADAEPKPWRVRIGQRVPQGAEPMIANGSELQVAYLEKDGGDTVAVDWPPSSDGRFSRGPLP